MNKYGMWNFNFVAGSPVEFREIGPSYWPFLLRVFFDAAENWTPHRTSVHNSYFLKACIHTLKTGEFLCFANETVTLPSCSASKSDFRKSVLAVSILSFILILLIFTLLSAAFIWYRRTVQILKYDRNRTLLVNDTGISNSQEESFTTSRTNTPPILLTSKQFDTVSAQQQQLLTIPCSPNLRSGCSFCGTTLVADSARNSAFEECVLQRSHMLGRAKPENSMISRCSAKESKLVQTSLNSLVTPSGGDTTQKCGENALLISQRKTDTALLSSISSGISSLRESPV